jgi:hypothetical protein
MRLPAALKQQVISLYRSVLGLLIGMHGASALFGVFGGSEVVPSLVDLR